MGIVAGAPRLPPGIAVDVSVSAHYPHSVDAPSVTFGDEQLSWQADK